MKIGYKLSLKQKRAIAGYVFSLPFILGFLFFFIVPFFQAVNFSINEVEIGVGGFQLSFAGFDNFSYIFFEHPDFIPEFINTIRDMLVNLPLILSFSFFSALVLNQKFSGRTFSRAIFFLPVIMSAGIVLRMEQGDYISGAFQQVDQVDYIFSGVALRELLAETRLPEDMVLFVLDAVERIPEIIRASGIQIIVFLAGLQSIPRSIYEAAEVEGATSWENFWLITLPMLSPLILTNIVYTIIDSFISPQNELIELIRGTAFGGAGFGISMAMAMLYFLSILSILGIVFKLLSGWVFYQE